METVIYQLGGLRIASDFPLLGLQICQSKRRRTLRCRDPLHRYPRGQSLRQLQSSSTENTAEHTTEEKFCSISRRLAAFFCRRAKKS